ncbi:MAG: DUF3592 domain-containing protein [Terriglobales bacterium]
MLRDRWGFKETRYERNARRAQSAGQHTGCIFVLLVLSLGGWHVYQLARILESAFWQKAAGMVVSNTSEPGTLVSFVSYTDVHYAYTVKGRGYTSQTLRWGSEYHLTRSAAAQDAARYPVGTEVEVYYDPDEPSDAVLERGFNRFYAFDVLLTLIVVGLAFLVTNVVFAGAARERMKYDQS